MTLSDGIAGVRTIVMLEADVNYDRAIGTLNAAPIKAGLDGTGRRPPHRRL